MSLSEYGKQLKAENAEWLRRSLSGLKTFCELNRDISMEVFRADWDREPVDANSWGALARAAVKEFYMEDSGMCMKAVRPESKGRKITIWKSLIFVE